jgi:hypothetical protein
VAVVDARRLKPARRARRRSARRTGSRAGWPPRPRESGSAAAPARGSSCPTKTRALPSSAR